MSEPESAARNAEPGPLPDFSSGIPSSVPRIARLARKELREILRDRRTIVTLIAMPILLYPLMSVAFQTFYVASLASPDSASECRVAAVTNAEWQVFKQRYDQGVVHTVGSKKQDNQAKKAGTTLQPIHLGARPKDDAERAKVLEILKNALREGEIDLIVAIPNLDVRDGGPSRDRFLACQIYALPNNAVARAALARIEGAFAAVNEHDLKARLNVPGASARIAVLSLRPEMLAAGGPDVIISLAALVPLVLILMTITGAVYPAIDLTAGERERGTLEILVAAPVPRFELLTAKYLSVVTVAVLTAIVNLVCMTLTLQWSGLGAVLIQGGLSVELVLQVFGLMLLFAGFFSAVLLCLTSFARSFKEAQAYLIPLMLGSIAPGVLAMIPGLKLTGVLTVLPLINVVLLARDLVGDGADAVTATVVVISTVLYALAALSLAARVFGAESVLYSEQSGWSDLVRRPDGPQATATIPAMLWCLALMIPIQFVLLAVVRPSDPAAVSSLQIVILSVAANGVVFGLLPALFAYLGRVQPVSGVGLTTPRLSGWVVGLLLAISLWPWQLWLLSFSNTAAMLEERFGNLLRSLGDARESLGWGVLLVVVVPAILEEIFFRGLLFSALKVRSNAWVTVLASAVLFGLSHVMLPGSLGLDRLVPSTILGLVLGVVRLRTGSLWPCILQHVGHNAILLILGLQAPGSTNDIPWEWLAGGAAGTGIAVFFLWRSRPSAS